MALSGHPHVPVRELLPLLVRRPQCPLRQRYRSPYARPDSDAADKPDRRSSCCVVVFHPGVPQNARRGDGGNGSCYRCLCGGTGGVSSPGSTGGLVLESGFERVIETAFICVGACGGDCLWARVLSLKVRDWQVYVVLTPLGGRSPPPFSP